MKKTQNKSLLAFKLIPIHDNVKDLLKMKTCKVKRVSQWIQFNLIFNVLVTVIGIMC